MQIAQCGFFFKALKVYLLLSNFIVLINNAEPDKRYFAPSVITDL